MQWLDENEMSFPDPGDGDDDGLIAIGGDLSPERLLFAYSLGLFPWFNEDDPILWWSPNPRLVLFPADLKVSKSMRPYFNQGKFTVSYNRCFRKVMEQCAAKSRIGQEGGTWISADIIDAYSKLHQLGFAHSVEVWDKNEQLIGGLYGIALGKVFYGESMFSHVSNASKFGFITMVQNLSAHEFKMIDCQQETAHLTSLGAKSIARTEFMDKLFEWTKAKPLTGFLKS
ncbi:MAG: leucyl/phenylalanyl-tRNA--protein transferase [Saprospiraceae bacterium]